MPASNSTISGSAKPAVQRHKPAAFVIRSIGVVGLGHMGHAFATNLAEDGYQVLVYDRDPKRVAALVRASFFRRL
jgi:UDP-N-acetyl-D-mannosaminuronate dehydrogenase